MAVSLKSKTIALSFFVSLCAGIIPGIVGYKMIKNEDESRRFQLQKMQADFVTRTLETEIEHLLEKSTWLIKQSKELHNQSADQRLWIQTRLAESSGVVAIESYRRNLKESGKGPWIRLFRASQTPVMASMTADQSPEINSDISFETTTAQILLEEDRLPVVQVSKKIVSKKDPSVEEALVVEIQLAHLDQTLEDLPFIGWATDSKGRLVAKSQNFTGTPGEDLSHHPIVRWGLQGRALASQSQPFSDLPGHATDHGSVSSGTKFEIFGFVRQSVASTFQFTRALLIGCGIATAIGVILQLGFTLYWRWSEKALLKQLEQNGEAP